MATLFSHLLAERGLVQPQFKALFEQTARDLGLAGLTVADRTFRRWITGETVRPVNATLVVLSHLFPEVRPIERLFRQVAPDGTPLHASPADRARIQEQALREALATVGRRARDLGWQAVIGEAQRESATADEARAFSLRIFQNAVVPALLQVPAYTRAIFEAASPPYPAEIIEAGIEDRASRQELLARPDGPFLYVVIAEWVLGCPVGGPDTLREQLLHLLEVSRLPRVDMRVLPTSVGAHPSMDGGFELIDFAADAETPAAYHFTNIGSLRLEDGQVGAYRVRFESLTGLALSPERSRDLVEATVSRSPEEPRHDEAPP